LGKEQEEAMKTASARLRPAVPAVLLLLRLVAGLIMAYHGLQKFQGGVSNFAAGIDSLGVPAATLIAWIVSILELVGGLMVAVGIFARIAAALLIIEMFFTGVYVQLVKLGTGLIAAGDQPGTGAERDFLYLVAFLTVATLGPGRYSVDAAMGREESEPAGPRARAA
jgi:putative oxidoreductase